jgi:hypothetical protein
LIVIATPVADEVCPGHSYNKYECYTYDENGKVEQFKLPELFEIGSGIVQVPGGYYSLAISIG